MTDAWWIDAKQLDDEQNRVIDLPLGRHHLLVGPPGSGKTNLLLLRANYLILAGQPNVLLLVFTKSLREFVAAGARGYQVPLDRISTCTKWQMELMHQYGMEIRPPVGDFHAQREYFLASLRSLVAKYKLQRLYDAILLDEAQDYLPEEIDLFFALAGVVFATADARQKLYKGDSSLERIEAKAGRPIVLKHHYRNGPQICRLADAIAGTGDGLDSLLATANYDEKKFGTCTVEEFRFASLEEQARAIVERVTLQLKAYPGQLIGVMAPRKKDVSALWNLLRASSIGDRCELQQDRELASFSAERPVCVTNFYTGKGLEFRALHLAACEGLKGMPYPRNLAYTAVTRAKTSLSIYSAAPLIGFLEGALAALKPVPPLPSRQAAFRGRP